MFTDRKRVNRRLTPFLFCCLAVGLFLLFSNAAGAQQDPVSSRQIGLLTDDEHTYLHHVFKNRETVETAGGSINGRGKFLSTNLGSAYQPLEPNSHILYPGKPGFPVKQGTLELIVSDLGLAAPTIHSPTLIHFFQHENRQVFLRLNAGRIQFIVYAWAGSWITAKSKLPIWNLKSLHHITIVWEGTRAKMFLDGKEQEVSSREEAGLVAPIPFSSAPKIAVGNGFSENSPSCFAIQELRVSTVVRYKTPEDFKSLSFLET